MKSHSTMNNLRDEVPAVTSSAQQSRVSDPELDREVKSEIKRANARRAKYMLIMTAVLELVLIVIHDLPFIVSQPPGSVRAAGYFALHLVIFLAALAGLAYALTVLGRQQASPGVERDGSFNPALAGVSFILIAATALITGLDQSFSDSISVYSAMVLLISVLVLTRPPLNFVIFLSSHLVFIISMVLHQPDPVILRANIINGTIISISAMVLSTVFYRSSYDHFVNTVLLREANRKLKMLSTHDYLTQLYNRRFFYDYMEQELLFMKRYSVQCALAIFDFDDFKEINDRQGHTCGDQVLKRFAALLKSQCRESDLAVRWGGEEFVMVLFKAPLEQAAAVAERVRRLQEQAEPEPGSPLLPVTVSAGVVMLEDYSIAGIDHALTLADRALHQAKQAGKNRVVPYRI